MEEKKLHIYNTMSRQKEEFIPLIDEWKKDFVWIYSCGPTVYWNPHIWNMRAFAFADLLRNIVRNVLWYKTKHVMNLTDVGHLTDDWDEWEDKMEKWAKRENKTVWELADMYIEKFYSYLDKLQIDKFDVMPRATDHIKEQIEMVKILEEKWYTYEIPDDGIYMDTSKVADYGKLAWLQNQERIAGARIQNDNKKNDTDFALWKFSPKDQKRQMERDSPWWIWFPGWHIECSAMSSKYLWDQFDIHTWWVDHIWVHHTNEIAQSECTFWKKPWVKYWMHNQFLNLWWKKLSKSAWGLVTVDDLEEKWYSGLDLKLLYYTAHYRNFLDFNETVLEQSKVQRKNLIKKISKAERVDLKWKNYKEIADQLKTDEWIKFLSDCLDALLDDLNSPKLLATINSWLKNSNPEIIWIIVWLDKNVMKLDLLWENEKSEVSEDIPEEITELANQRLQAKQEKNYALADELRAKIQEKWYNIKDIPWEFEIEKM